MEGTIPLWHEVARHRGRGVGGVFWLGKQVTEHLRGSGRIKVNDGGDVPKGVAHAATIADRSTVAGRSRGPGLGRILSMSARMSVTRVHHVFGFSYLCNRRRLGWLSPRR